MDFLENHTQDMLGGYECHEKSDSRGNQYRERHYSIECNELIITIFVNKNLFLIHHEAYFL